MQSTRILGRGLRRQRGAALLTTLVFLGVLTILGVTTMQGTRNQERMAGNFKRSGDLERAAETSLRTAIAALRNDPPGDFSEYDSGGGFATIETDGSDPLDDPLSGAGLYQSNDDFEGTGSNPPRPFANATSWGNSMIAVRAPETPTFIQGQFYIQFIGRQDPPNCTSLSASGASSCDSTIDIFEVTARGVRGNDDDSDNIIENVDDQIVLQARVGQGN